MKFHVYKVMSAKQGLIYLAGGTAALFLLIAATVFVANPAIAPVSTTGDYEKKVYLTFDDGPSPVTEQVLSILEEKQVKATFFVVGVNVNTHPDIIKKAVQQGHAIGVHSNTHVYGDIYKSTDAFFGDFDALYQSLSQIIGTPPVLYRFPGGSSNTLFKRYAQTGNIMEDIKVGLTQRSVNYVDWNVSGEDAVGRNRSASAIAADVINQVHKQYPAVVLLHDTADRKTSAEALPQIIDTLQSEGFTFAALDSTISCKHNIDAFR